MTLLAPHLTAFLAERLPKERRASVHTCDTYAYAFKLLVVWAAERLRTTPSALTLEQLDAPCLLAFLEHLETERKNTVRSRNARLAALKSFARFVEYRVPACVDQVRRILAIPAKKGDEGLVGYLTRPEMQALLDAPTQHAPPGLRDRAMLHLAYAGGLRVSELVGLCITDLTLQPTATVLVRGKGRRERVLPLWKTTTKALREWLSVRQTTTTPALFTNAHGEPLTRAGFAHVLAQHVATATRTHPSLASKRVSPHVLRHTCAMHTLEATGDIRKVALWLGHATLQSTEVYVRADPTEKLDALRGTVPATLRPGRFRPPDQLIAALRPAPKGRGYVK
jgi:site-specific recombinase XerD